MTFPSPGSSIPPVLEDLAREIAVSQTFNRSKRHAGLLLFLATENASELKETVIGHRFFERPADYDPKLDPIVRVEIRRLRERLERYYQEEAPSHPWKLEISKGAYRLSILRKGELPETIVRSLAPGLQATPKIAGHRLWTGWLIASAVALMVVGSGMMAAHRYRTAPVVRSISVLEVQTAPGVSNELASGLAAEIAASLSRIDNLLVVGPAASGRAQKANQKQDVRQIAIDLQVEAVLSSILATSGNRTRLQMQLIRGSDGAVLWAATEERESADPFTFQAELAARVATAVFRKGLRQIPSARVPTEAALLAYRRGAVQMERHSGPGVAKAIGLFESAVSLYPEYSVAWSALAEAYALRSDYESGFDPDWSLKALQAAHTALTLDPDNSDAYSALAWVTFSKELNVREARRLLLCAIRLNPNSTIAHRRLGLLYSDIGQFTDAESALKTAARLDPLSPMAQINLAEMLYRKGDRVGEERVLRIVLDFTPSLVVGQVMLAVVLSETNHCREASNIATRLMGDVEAKEWRASMAMVLYTCGDPGPSRTLAAMDEPRGAADYLSVTTGDWVRARKYFAHSIKTRPLLAFNLGANPLWVADPEIQRQYRLLMARVSLSDR